MDFQKETIVALATPFGRGSVGILRISGLFTISVARALLKKLPKARQAEYLPFYDKKGSILDQGIALFFPSPNSLTGEDVLELQGHGSPIVLDLLLQHIISLPGVRIARPGEFSERAFLNGKIDLTQAEAVADLINASSKQAVRSAMNSLQGVFSTYIYELVRALTSLRIKIEASLDFPSEDINYVSNSKIENDLNDIIVHLNGVRTETYQRNLFREGMKVVITGKPNSGKSSLLNALAGYDVAIVSAISGTTRDILHEYINLDGMPLHIIDTAGLHNTTDEVEKIGIERAWREIEKADHVLLMVDSINTPIHDTSMIWSELRCRLSSSIPITVVRNKADLTGEDIAISKTSDGIPFITLSARFGLGLDLLRNYLKKSVEISDCIETSFLARRRHLDAIDIAAKHLNQGKLQLVEHGAIELLAEELRLAQQALNEITGEFRSNDLLEKIFSNFCIGK